MKAAKVLKVYPWTKWHPGIIKECAYRSRDVLVELPNGEREIRQFLNEAFNENGFDWSKQDE